MCYKTDLDPTSNRTIAIKLFKNVENVPQLREKLMKGELACCIIKPSLIVDAFQVVVAANKAVTAESLTTKSVYTEILFNLSISKNISQSLQKFGIHDKDKELLVAVLGKDNVDAIFNEIEGEEVDLSVLKQLNDEKLIKKTYKISDAELKTSSILDSVVSRIATKDFVSH